MKFFKIMLYFIVVIFYSCEDSLKINTYKNTYYDDISDITYLNESFLQLIMIFQEMQAIKLT